MAETVNQGNNNTGNQNNQNAQGNQGNPGSQGGAGKTFTQEELNAIVADRLSREREKYAGYDDLKKKAEKFDEIQNASKSELQKAQEQAEKYKLQLDAIQKDMDARNAREKVAQEKGVPASLLTGTTEEECGKQADALLSWRTGGNKYPNVQDPGGNTPPQGGKTRDQFASWFEEAIKK